MRQQAFVSLGSNLGDNLLLNFDIALSKLKYNGNIKIVNTSSAFLTKAMKFGQIVENEPNYVNAVVKIETKLDPFQLLTCLQSIEKEMGRTLSKSKLHQARIIDLDILFYGTIRTPFYKENILEIPHPQITKRDFVLIPLQQIMSQDEYQNIAHLNSNNNSNILQTIIGCQFSYGENLNWKFTEKGQHITQRIGIMNATPDSFSDGGQLIDPEKRAIELIERYKMDGIDIGGESTRPNAKLISVQEELSRILPVVEKVKNITNKLSIDTTKYEVAKECLQLLNGLVINDISGGEYNDHILKLVSSNIGSGIVLMHSKGTPETMDLLSKQYDGNNSVRELIGKELKIKLDRALRAGIPRWRICLDPGLGFAKSHSNSKLLLESSNEIRSIVGGGIPIMIGHSRKRFLKPSFLNISGDSPWPSLQVRDEVNELATQKAIQGGADLVRIHCA